MGNFQCKNMVYLQKEPAVSQASSFICLKQFSLCQTGRICNFNLLTEISLYISVVLDKYEPKL